MKNLQNYDLHSVAWWKVCSYWFTGLHYRQLDTRKLRIVKKVGVLLNITHVVRFRRGSAVLKCTSTIWLLLYC